MVSVDANDCFVCVLSLLLAACISNKPVAMVNAVVMVTVRVLLSTIAVMTTGVGAAVHL